MSEARERERDNRNVRLPLGILVFILSCRRIRGWTGPTMAGKNNASSSLRLSITEKKMTNEFQGRE